MKSVMVHQFSRVPHANIQRSTFKRAFGYKTTMDSGYLVPIYVDEALPGDTFQMNGTLFGRFSTPIVPIMDNVYLETFFFAVPIRLVWDHWQRFNGEQKNPGDSTDFVIPQITLTGDQVFEVGSLADYFGIPTNVKKLSVSALWHRAYNLIWNEWFRNENLQRSAAVPTNDGPDDPSWYPLLKRCKRKDYFTSALPWPQKGPGVELPIGEWSPVVVRDAIADGTTGDFGLRWTDTTTGDGLHYNDNRHFLGIGGAPEGFDQWSTHVMRPSDGGAPAFATGVKPRNLWADLSASTSATINTVRQAFQVQRLLERDAIGGTRYIEIIRSHFGVVSPDARLQRPEYLGGSSDQIHFAPVQQTSATDDVTPQGNLAAYGVVGGSHHGFSKSFTEHCLIIGLANIRADLTYQQGIPRMFSRKTRFDFYWPALSHLGEQAVLNKEIYAQGTAADEEVFGYQERYAEYRYYPSKITGKFRSTDPQSLDVWHLSQKFGSLPHLNREFIEENPPIKRILAVQDEPELLLDCYFENITTRPMPLYGTPGLVDHF